MNLFIPNNKLRKPMEDKLYQMRHTAAHALAQAVLEMYPEAKLAIGPATEDGFYYDFDLGGKTFSPQDLPKFEKRMQQIIKENQKLRHEEIPAAVMVAYLKEKNQPYKVELAEQLIAEGNEKLGKSEMVKPNGVVAFTDLCGRPHVKQTKDIGAVKLLKIAGAYWRGDEHKPMLQRIYGTAFPTQAELDGYLEMLRLAEERDHRKLGQELDL